MIDWIFKTEPLHERAGRLVAVIGTIAGCFGALLAIYAAATM